MKLDRIFCAALSLSVTFTIAMMVLMFTSCKTIHDTEIVTKHDTLTVYQQQRDSIELHDSIYVENYIQGDTVIRYKYVMQTRYRDRIKHDSIYIAKVDTVVVERTIEKQPTFMDKAKQKVGGFIMAAVFAVAAFFGLRWLFMRWADRR